MIVDVLVERAAERDVENLDTAAHGERRLIAGDDRSGDRDIGGITAGVDRTELVVMVMSVGRGVDIAPAGDDDRVDRVEQRLDIGRIDDGQDEWRAPGAMHGLHVRRRRGMK